MIRFLKDELLPYAEEDYGPFFHKTQFGYSLGGIFTLQTLMTEPVPFDSSIAGRPSLWYRYDYYEAITIAASKSPAVLMAFDHTPSTQCGN
jgi:predicted alpha/beta superfamily hydrolase